MGLRDYFDTRLGPCREEGGELRYNCPFCGSTKYKFYVHNAEDNRHGLWHCWHCGERGNMIGFIMRYDNEGYESAKDILYEYDSDLALGMKLTNNELTTNENLLLLLSSKNTTKEEAIETSLTKIKPPTLPAPPLPRGLKQFSPNAMSMPTANEKPFIDYLKGRGFTQEDINNYGIAYIIYGSTIGRDNKTIYINNHIVFFTYDDKGNYLYWNTRAIYNTIPKSINAPDQGENTFLSKGDVIFNLDRAKTQPVVVLVEGVPDAITLGTKAVATFGKGLTDIQKGLLVQTLDPKQSLLLMLDMDASYQMLELAKELGKYHKKTFMIFNPTNQDANSLGAHKAWSIISHNIIQATDKGILEFKTKLKRN